MNNYAIASKYPSAHLTKRKSRLKIYNGNVVFLDNGDFFEFEVHNPKHNSVLCKIKINGNYISQTGLVLKPGQRVFLERFLDSNNKFQFNTYDVENNPENRDAIRFNGDIQIEFYDEEMKSYNSINTFGTSTNVWNSINTGNPFITTITTGTPYLGGITFTSSNSTYSVNTAMSSNIETGRIEKGETSKQELSYDNTSFKPDFINIVSYKILPYSQKNRTTDDIRNYCSECGKKMKKEYKFCPSCGNKI